MKTTSLRYPRPSPPLMQCAAVISRSRPGLDTTLAVQKWFPLPSRVNRAPTRGAARVVCALGDTSAICAAPVRPTRQARAESSRAVVQEATALSAAVALSVRPDSVADAAPGE